MRTRTIQQLEVIESQNAADFQTKVNDTLRQLDDVVEVLYPENKGFCALIRYNMDLDEPESIADEYLLKYGKSYTCFDCPLLEIDPDRRATSHWCSHQKDRTGLKTPACDAFYSLLEAGKAQPVTAADRKRQFAAMDADELERRRKHARLVQAEATAKRETLREEQAAGTRYYFQWPLPCPPEYEALNNHDLTARQASTALRSKKILREADFIALAKKSGGEVYRCSAYNSDITPLWPPEWGAIEG